MQVKNRSKKPSNSRNMRRKEAKKPASERTSSKLHEVLGMAISDVFGAIHALVCQPCDLSTVGMTSDECASYENARVSVNVIDVPQWCQEANQSPDLPPGADEVSCLTEAPESPMKNSLLEKSEGVKADKDDHEGKIVFRDFESKADTASLRVLAIDGGDTTLNTSGFSELRSTPSMSSDFAFSQRECANIDFSRECRIQWAIQRNVLPGLDRWKGILRRTAQSAESEAPALGLVQGFWIRRPQNKNGKFTTQPLSVSPDEVDLVALQNMNASLGHFWRTAMSRGWPTINHKKRKGADKENQCINGTPADDIYSANECCLVAHVWIMPQYRGNGWGLIMADKASRVIPRRYRRKREQLVATSSNTTANDAHVVLALPPYNKKLQTYFGEKGGWSQCWDPDLLTR